MVSVVRDGMNLITSLDNKLYLMYPVVTMTVQFPAAN